jgi:Mitochondrial mRNA-processing protein COX24, C-terminal
VLPVTPPPTVAERYSARFATPRQLSRLRLIPSPAAMGSLIKKRRKRMRKKKHKKLLKKTRWQRRQQGK